MPIVAIGRRTSLAAVACFAALALGPSAARAQVGWPHGYGAPASAAVAASGPGYAAASAVSTPGYAAPTGYYAAPAAYPVYACPAYYPYGYAAPVAHHSTTVVVAPAYAAPQTHTIVHAYPVRPARKKVTFVQETRARAVEVKYTRTRLVREQWR